MYVTHSLLSAFSDHWQRYFCRKLTYIELTIFCLFSVHLKVDEKICLTAGRDGGLQNMEVRGLMLLRISDAEYGRITVAVDNQDKFGFQMQVC